MQRSNSSGSTSGSGTAPRRTTVQEHHDPPFTLGNPEVGLADRPVEIVNVSGGGNGTSASGTNAPDVEEMGDPAVQDWIDKRVKQEVEKLKASGCTGVLPFKVKNTGIVRTDRSRIIHRVEVATGFDFEKVTQTMVSEPEPCPVKKDFSYVNVLLFTDESAQKMMPILVPYLVKTSMSRNLEYWRFVNNQLKYCDLKVDLQ